MLGTNIPHGLTVENCMERLIPSYATNFVALNGLWISRYRTQIHAYWNGYSENVVSAKQMLPAANFTGIIIQNWIVGNTFFQNKIKYKTHHFPRKLIETVEFMFHAIHINFMENRNRNACFLWLVSLDFFISISRIRCATPALFIVTMCTFVQRTMWSKFVFECVAANDGSVLRVQAVLSSKSWWILCMCGDARVCKSIRDLIGDYVRKSNITGEIRMRLC